MAEHAQADRLPLGWPETWRVVARRQDTHDTATLELERLAAAPFVFTPGQFNMIYVPGRGEVAISISGDPARSERLVHTVRAVGAATRALTALEPRAELGIRGPFGRGWPVAEARDRHVVVVAGGIGLAPLRPLILALAASAHERARRGLSTTLYYGARAPAERIYGDEVEGWAALPGFRVLSTVDQAGSAWTGAVGVVTSLMTRPLADGARTLAVLCGPEIMMRFAAVKLEQLGLARDDIWVSLERNMKCALGSCGHCQLGARFLCKDGPVFHWADVEAPLRVREL